ncbi:hypothetical protein ACP8HI_04090 [Paenibacillus sp. FA6]|uniref:hypothetical protein n=1 Tax=Paenibacillus sp. FA6 TaxID=3413029 RepID=UPI003F65D550
MNNNDNFRQSQLNLPAKGPWVVKDETHTVRKKSVSRGSSMPRKKRMRASARKIQGKVLFVGPSIEGSDKEYVKVLSGTVYEHKPSFA